LPENNTSDVLYVGEMPFESLFPRLSAIVYHGGTGTMAAAARAGIPQVAFPFMADQFENRKRIVQLGLGPNACDFKKILVQEDLNKRRVLESKSKNIAYFLYSNKSPG